MITHASRARLQWLLKLVRGESAVVQVHDAVSTEAFVLLSLDDGQRVVCYETPTGPQTSRVVNTMGEFVLRFDALAETAMDEATSRDYLESWALL